MANLVADARALTPGQYGHLVVYGSTALGDGGGGFYVWASSAANVDDGADWLKPASITHPDPGRWQRVWTPPQLASTIVAGLVQLGADGNTTAGNVVQCSDTRLHPGATLAGTPAYITIDTGTQVITRALVDLAAHVTGLLPMANLGNLATATETAATRTNTAADRSQFVRFTNTGAITYTVNTGVAATGDTWQGINAVGPGNLVFAQGGGFALTGNLIFEPLKTYTLRFVSSSAADVIGGTA